MIFKKHWDERISKRRRYIANEIRHLIVAKEFIENELKGRWNSKMDTEAFKKFVYFPIKRKEKESQKEEQKKSGSNIFKLPPMFYWNY